MINVLIDTALLAIPNYAIDEEEADSLIDRVIHFSRMALDATGVRLVIAENTEELLWENHCGAGVDEIDQFLQLMELSDVFDARDIAQQYQVVLSRSARSEDKAPIHAQLVEGFACEPALPQGLGPGFLSQETERVLSTVAASIRFEPLWLVGSSFKGTSEFYNVEASILAGEGSRASDVQIWPLQVAEVVNCIEAAGDLVRNRRGEWVWRYADSVSDAYIAILLRAAEMLGDECRPLETFSLGPAFLESLRANQCVGSGAFAGVALEVCAQLVAGTITRPIGTFGKPDQEVRSFDRALGWRVHLTGAHAGLRLMFWRSDRGIEFANVGPKHELLIEKGKRNGDFRGTLGRLIERQS